MAQAKRLQAGLQAGLQAAALGGTIAACAAAAAVLSVVGGTAPKPDKKRWRWTVKLPACRCEQGQLSHRTFDRDWDCRHPNDDGPDVALQGNTRLILLIRHGQYETKGGPGYGRLTALGQEQARMAGKHVVARMRMDQGFKKAMLKMTSSNMLRAIETADIIEREILTEMEWVDVLVKNVPGDMLLQYVDLLEDGSFMEFSVTELTVSDTVVITDKGNLLQPRLEMRVGSRVRIPRESREPIQNEWRNGVRLANLAAALPRLFVIAVHQKLQPRRALDDRFEEWTCSGCDALRPNGCIHWSDDAENNGLGFCDECWESGRHQSKVKTGDTLSRITKGNPISPFRAPNDSNLNEADVDTCSILLPGDPLWKGYGEMHSQILRDQARINAAFYNHMHRSVDHKRIRRKERTDTIPFTFMTASGERLRMSWTQKEFEKLEFNDKGRCPWIMDGDARQRIKGTFQLITVGYEDVSRSSIERIRYLVADQAKTLADRPSEKQVEIYVLHQNVIRYLLLKLMQFDTRAWLNFGGGNCTMTQLRITKRGDVICDFFGDHGSMMPVSHYTFNKIPDY